MTRSGRSTVSLATLALALIGAAPRQVSTPPRLPDRLLRCSLGRVTNFDPQGYQKPDDLHYEGRHDFSLFLPGGPVRTHVPPDPIDPPEPVDPRTTIVADPDRIAAGPSRFDRVVDYWPDRVELTTTIDGPLVNLIIVHPVDVARRTANLFMTQATDLTAFDTAHLYQGRCDILEGDAARVTR